MARELRRYRNRKMYDPIERGYVSLAHVTQLVRAGEEVTVRDQDTGEDRTTHVLAQALALEELRKPNLEVRAMLVEALRFQRSPFK